MALWGNNDNLVSNGTVALNYATKVVTGAGTTFGTVGFGVTGDVIRFGARGSGGTYFGDAVIASIASTQSVTIGSTAGLTGGAISGAQYKLSELPSSTVGDFSYSEKKLFFILHKYMVDVIWLFGWSFILIFLIYYYSRKTYL